LWNQTFIGFCIGGRVRADRTPAAYVVKFQPWDTSPPQSEAIPQNTPLFWGQPNMMDRLLMALDGTVYQGILNSDHWKGSIADLDALIQPHALYASVQLPLREAIDWIYSSIYITIKAMKFYKKPQFCGGPIEVAVITADRQFRWVRHKSLGQALDDHDARGEY